MKKFLLALFTLFGTFALYAQVTTSSMSGKITDSAGHPLIGAAVVAVHTPSGTQYGAAVDMNGNYRLLNMRPGGPYTVSVQMLGYQTSEYTGIELALGDNYILNADLFESALGMDEIVVRGTGRDNMNTDRAGAITTVNSKAIAAQPTVSRSMNDIIKLSPQAATTSNGLAIGGGNYRQSYVTVDGAAFNNAFGIGGNLPANGSPISLDALEQISVSVTPYDVRQSGFTGGAINAVTKSGNNEFRGTAYTYMNNERFKGTKYKGGELAENAQKYLMYGFTFGGPIIKNKLFFFVNGEYENQVSPGPSTRARPSTSDSYGSGTNYNRPTVDFMDEVREHLINKYSYDPGAYQDYSLKTPSFKILARIDWNISEDHKLNVRWSTTKNKSSNSMSQSVNPLKAIDMYGYSGSRTGANGMATFKNSRYWDERNFNSVAAELNSRFGNVNNTFRVTYSHQDEPRSWDGGNFPLVDILENENGNNTPIVSFGIDPFTYGNFRDVQTVVLTDDVNWNWGINNLTAGLQYEFDRTKNGYMQFGLGWYVFETWDDFVNGAKPYSFAVTHPNNSGLNQEYPMFDYHQTSLYIQDKVDISDNFKLTLGLRAEVPIFPSLQGNYNEKFAALKFMDGKQYSTDQMPKARVEVAPRIGFNWDIMGDRKHVIRGGTGIFTGRIPFVWIVSTVGNSGVKQVTYSATPKNGTVPNFTTDLNEMLNQIYGGTYTPTTALNTGSTIMSKNLKMPNTWKTSLAYDIRLPGGVNGSVEGIFNKDINTVYVKNVGLKEPTETLILSANDVRLGYIGQDVDKFINNVDGAGMNAYLIENSKKNGYYYSLSFKVDKTFHFGLNAMAAYTFSDSRTVGDGIGDQLSGAWSTNINNVGITNEPTLSYSSFVAPHRLIASIGYQWKGTGINLFYEGYNLGFIGSGYYSYTRYSYIYNSNVIGDTGSNNLIYVPSSKNELKFADYTLNGEVYTATQQAEDFWNFVNQDKYLKTRKGKYAERNGAIMPWRSRFDLKFTQDYVLNNNGKKNILQIGVDITNFANLLYKKWGNVRTINTNAILGATRQNDGSYTYTFRPNGSQILTKTSSPAAQYASTYSVQLSFRYTFN